MTSEVAFDDSTIEVSVLPSAPRSLTKKLKESHAFIGDNILFTRKRLLIQGTVTAYRAETVLVEIDIKSKAHLGIDNNMTVVSHKHYEVI